MSVDLSFSSPPGFDAEPGSGSGSTSNPVGHSTRPSAALFGWLDTTEVKFRKAYPAWRRNAVYVLRSAVGGGELVSLLNHATASITSGHGPISELLAEIYLAGIEI